VTVFGAVEWPFRGRLRRLCAGGPHFDDACVECVPQVQLLRVRPTLTKPLRVAARKSVHAAAAHFVLTRLSEDYWHELSRRRTMRNKLLLGSLTLGAAALLTTGTGCFGRAGAGAYTEVDAPVVFAEEPTLVAVEPNVWVVRDYDDAVYYVDGYYWLYRDDGWRRSQAYDRGWMTVEVSFVPRIIVSRNHHAYVHYHGASNAPIRRAPRERDVGPDNHDRSGRPDDRRAAPPRRDNDNATPRPPQHDNAPRPPVHDNAPRPEHDNAPRAPERAGDRHEAPQGHDARPSVQPRDQGPQGNERRDDNKQGGKKDERDKR